MKSIFSVDVEDWFHILGLRSVPRIDEWPSLPSRVEANFMALLDMFDERGVAVTCFFLGWVAERFPHLVREAAGRGHEIASHGYAHELAYRISPADFLRDAVMSKHMLEDLTGAAVKGYRCAGFSTTEATPWFFDKLAEAGYAYDSSVFPAARAHGGMTGTELGPHFIRAGSRGIVEFPISVAHVLGRPVCFFGGGYLRLFPYSVIRRMGARVLREGRPVVFYIHPREIDPCHPRLPMGLMRKFKCYVNLRTAKAKVESILRDFDLTTFERFIEEGPLQGVRGDVKPQD
jgi:polysaccharide deacetylase family protein (PEP-CTERM system associated)